MRNSFDVCAVGGGPDALVAAAFLARAGRSVLVVEEPGAPAGIAANVELAPGFRFGVAPETLPSLDPKVAEALGLSRHGLEVLAPDPVLTVLGHETSDGPQEPLSLFRGPEKARRELASRSPSDAEAFPRFTAELGAMAGFLRRLLDQPPLELRASFAEAFPAAMAALGLGASHWGELLRTLPMAVADFLDDHFESPALKAALAGPALTGTRLGPRAPGTAGLFLHFHAFGQPDPLGWILLPRGGPGALGSALRKAARKAGAVLASRSGGVRRIAVEPAKRGMRTAGIELEDGRKVLAETVIADSSPETALLQWTGARHLPPDFVHEVRHIRYRGTAARVGLALSALPRLRGGPAGGPPEEDPRLGGIIQVGADPDDLERAADAFKYGETASRPLVFACLPSVHDAALAPEGGQVLAATVQTTPVRDGGDPARVRDRILERTLEALESPFPGIRGLVIGARVLTPADLEANHGLAEGSFHQGEPTMDQLYSLRPVPGFARHRTPVAGLYLAGPGTYPYGGLHGVSGRNAARAVEEDRSR